MNFIEKFLNKFISNENKENKETNSNFTFDDSPQYAKSSTGEIIPFKLFRASDINPTTDGVQWQGNSRQSFNTEVDNQIFVETQFTEYKGLNFSSGTKINNLDDVAWLFRNLEDEAVEHAFLLYRFHDDSFMVQHLSSGGITGTVVDDRLFTGNVLRVKPKSICLIHNHPSGQLKASVQDRSLLNKLRMIFNDTEVFVEKGIVINLRSGKYLVFDDVLPDEIVNLPKQQQEQNNIQTYTFSKKVFYENFQPQRILSFDDSAKFMSTQKFGVSDKNEIIILDNANNITAKLLMPSTNIKENLLKFVTTYSGTGVILYGNNVTPELYRQVKNILDVTTVNLLDAVQVKSNNGYLLLSSLKHGNDLTLEEDVYQVKEEPTSYVGGKIRDIALMAISNPDSLSQYDINTRNIINIYNNLNSQSIMENKHDEQNEMRFSDRYQEEMDATSSGFSYDDVIDETFSNLNEPEPNLYSENREVSEQEFQVGRLAMVKTEEGLFKGKIEGIAGNDISIKDLQGKTINAAKEQVYQFFPGQKYDISEIKELFQKPLGGVEFNQLEKEDMKKLMMGYLTDTMYKGVSNNEKTKGQEYEFKFRPEYNSAEKKLEMKPYFKDSSFDFTQKVFGEPLTQQQSDELKSGKSIQIDRINKNEVPYSLKVHYDDKLNKVIPDKFINTIQQEEKKSKGLKM